MPLSVEDLKKLFVDKDYLTRAEFEETVAESTKNNVPVEYTLVAKNLVDEEKLGEVIANALGYPFINLSKVKILPETRNIVPELTARAQNAVAFEHSPEAIKIALCEPQNLEFINLLERRTGEKVLVYYAPPTAIEEVLRQYKGSLVEQVKRLIEDVGANPANEEDIVKLVNLLVEYAHDNRASDIHIEPAKSSVAVRFRIDGVLHEVVQYPLLLHEKIVFRIKIMARLRTDEQSAAQDGRFDFKEDKGETFDVRVSIVPVVNGEDVVLRILSEHTRRLSLKGLGFEKKDLDKVMRAISSPYGMVLSTGPTGSGKTTTLYALLQLLDTPSVNIITIEDPVEYDMEHIQQIQVNPKKDLTFATGLRSIVRQDPNVIMVGEIRDSETAAIAVNAAMTGHLVLSTLHANDAATTLPRLLEMGLEPFLIASGVNVIVGQRLVRKLCEQCKAKAHLALEELEMIEADPVIREFVIRVSGMKDIKDLTVYKNTGKAPEDPKGDTTCHACDGVGYKGRTGIFEVLEMSDKIRALVVQRTSADIVNRTARELGMTSMLYDGITKILMGITTLSEVFRVTRT